MSGKKKTLLDNSWYPLIPSICECNCNEIIWNRNKFKRGHNNKTTTGKFFCHKINLNKQVSLETRDKQSKAQLGNKNAIGHKLKGKSKEKSSTTMFKKGQLPWNTNTHGLMPCGKNHSMFGKKHKPKSIEKMKEKKLKHNPMKGKHHSKESCKLISEINSGKNHWNWKGGKDISRKKRDIKRKQLEWNSLNIEIGNGKKKLKGYIRHHVNYNDIIYVPKEYIEDIVHNLRTGYNMETVNTISYFFLIMNNIRYLNKIFCNKI